jgi:hypothetical protein
LREVIDLIPGAVLRTRREALHQEVLQAPVAPAAEVQDAAAVDQLECILDQGEPVAGEALLLEGLELGDDDTRVVRLVRSDMLAARL